MEQRLADDGFTHGAWRGIYASSMTRRAERGHQINCNVQTLPLDGRQALYDTIQCAKAFYNSVTTRVTSEESKLN